MQKKGDPSVRKQYETDGRTSVLHSKLMKIFFL